MKRKVKFQEGGMVETPAQRRVRLAEDARTRSLELRDFEARQAQQRGMSQDAVRQFNQMPEVAERNERDTANRRRVGLAQRAREREQARQAAAREQAAARAASQAEVARFNERMNRAMPVTAEEARSLGAEPAQRPANPRPNIPPRVQAAAAGAVRDVASRGARRLVPGLNMLEAVSPTSLEAGAEFERANLRRAQLDAMQANLPAGPDIEAEQAARGPAPRPAAPAQRPAPRPRPAAAAPQEEISADRLNELAMGAEPMTRRERDAFNTIRNRREDLATAGTAFKKGGMVKPKAKPVAKKAGGMIGKPKAAPKKMMKGGMTAMPKPTVRSKSKSKPMPFKKGGKISMKGKK